MMEPRSVTVSKGVYGGPNVRITKGVSLNLGHFGSTARSHSEIRKVDTGIFTVTNNRIVFSGAMKTINVDFPKIIDSEPFADGVALRRSTSQKTQYFIWENTAATFAISVSGRVYEEPFTGVILQYLIEGLRNR